MNHRLLLIGTTALVSVLALTGCGSGTHPGATLATDQAAGASDATADPATKVARLAHDRVAVHADATSSSATVTTLRTTTALGLPTTLLVLDHREGWVDVALATRPNGSSGWVATADVHESTDDVVITVSLSDHLLRVTRGGSVAVETPIAVGAPGTPTPTGRFYVTDLVDTGKPNRAYGAFAFGISAHSDVLDQFGGGDGQIGIHGTNRPDSIGRSVSHGCVRVPDQVIEALAHSIPLGTPATIS